MSPSHVYEHMLENNAASPDIPECYITKSGHEPMMFGEIAIA
jgi:hypothetical protein